jgi:hypothetical protein
MKEKRYFHTASEIKDGKDVLLSGGWSGVEVLNSAEILP